MRMAFGAYILQLAMHRRSINSSANGLYAPPSTVIVMSAAMICPFPLIAVLWVIVTGAVFSIKCRCSSRLSTNLTGLPVLSTAILTWVEINEFIHSELVSSSENCVRVMIMWSFSMPVTAESESRKWLSHWLGVKTYRKLSFI